MYLCLFEVHTGQQSWCHDLLCAIYNTGQGDPNPNDRYFNLFIYRVPVNVTICHLWSEMFLNVQKLCEGDIIFHVAE